MKLDFTISEFNITGQPVPQEIADAILEYHILVMQPIRNAINAPIHVSLRSGYRPVWYEKEQGRTGRSQHTYANGKGATDWAAKDLDALQDLMLKHTPYTRICRYPTFIHADYKEIEGPRQYFRSDGGSWTFIKHLDNPTDLQP